MHSGRGPDQLEMFECKPRRAPSPPTGPTTMPPPKSAGRREDYEAWKASEGIEVYAFIEAEALRRLAAGERRISVNAMHELARARFKWELNNSFRPYIADDLVTDHPELLAVIERRRRRS